MSAYDREDFERRSIVSRETLAALDSVVETLDLWRSRSNLIGPREWDSLWSRHIWDSQQLRDLIPAEARIVDLGAGAGFPGLVLAASAEPPGHVTLIESIGKKCAFLRAAISEAGLPASVHQGRVESAPDIAADAVTARAFAPLPKLLDYAAPWLMTGAVGYFHKGARWSEELTAARETWEFSYDATASKSGGAGVILKLWEVRRAG
ncbi:MAG: 16S rRNA (guanine(527)-N(7))-methyltransferase RsmG [Pseudomonadota bacterium]